MNDNYSKLTKYLNDFIEKMLIINFYSEKSNLADLNRINKDISLIFFNLESATEIVIFFNFIVSTNP